MSGALFQDDPHFKPSADQARTRGALVGRLMGGFCLHDELASGGMASVYLAYKEGPRGIGQMAAIKVMHPHLAHRSDYVDMFLDEARISACISHPNVVRVLDFGQQDDSYYLAMEHLTGKTWYDVWRTTLDRAQPHELRQLPTLAAWVLSEACQGLHTAHEVKDLSGSRLNVVHRDISPQNVFVTFDGSVRVLDFGIASAEKRLHVTREGTIKGRIAYMSPEQMSSAPTDRRADVWSVGVLLWEALARQRLFARIDDAATVAAVLTAHLPTISPRVGKVPPELLAIALKALQRSPQDRFATAREMAEALSSFVDRSGGLSKADVSAHMQALFAEDIKKQELQRADAAEAFSMLTTQEVISTVKPARTLPMLDAKKADGNSDPLLIALEPSLSELLPTLVTTSEQESAKTVRSSARIARRLLPAALALTLVGIAPDLWVMGQRALSTGQRANLSDAAASDDTAVAELPGAERGTKDVLLFRRMKQSKEESPPSDAPSEARSAKRARAASEAPARARSQAAHPTGSGALAPERSQSAPVSAVTSRTRSQAKTPVRARSQAPKRAPKPAREQAVEKAALADAQPATESRHELAAQAAPGAVNVTTPGCWAVVYADGQRIGMSPGRFSLPAGQHTIEVVMQGTGPRELRTTEVRSGKTERVRVDCR